MEPLSMILGNIEPKRRAGEPVSSGRNEWVLKRFLGIHSFGESWLGECERFTEPCAFKFFTSENARAWLERETELLSRVRQSLHQCPNVVQCREIVADGDPYPFLVLDVAGGGSLEEWVLSPESERASFDIHDLMTGIARGLAAAHRHNVYHYDLRPANILFSDDTDPLPKIANFGMPRLESAQSAGGHMYLPPEAAGPGTKRAAAQDDVFAFGIIWHQVLTGKIERPPYDFVERLQRQGVAARCIRLVSRCLAHPDYRFKNGMELLDALEVEAVPLDWDVPAGCFDVSALAREYIESLGRQSPHAEA